MNQLQLEAIYRYMFITHLHAFADDGVDVAMGCLLTTSVEHCNVLGGVVIMEVLHPPVFGVVQLFLFVRVCFVAEGMNWEHCEVGDMCSMGKVPHAEEVTRRDKRDERNM